MDKGANNEVSSTQSTGDAVSISATNEDKSPAVGRVISGKLENYVILSHVQDCLYGSVMAGVGLTTGDAVAIKSLRRQDTDCRETASLSDLPETPLADVFFAPLLHGLKGVSVIREVIGLSDFHFVISGFANGEDLIELLKLYPYGLPESITSIAMRCAAEALAACHSKGVALQDFSLENCLLSCDMDGVYDIKLCDPGQATLFKIEGENEVPTEYKGCVGKKFRPPEIFAQLPYLSTKVDAWCLGWSTFYFMFAAEVFGSVHPMDEDYQWHLFSTGRYKELFQVCGIDESHVSPKSLDFIVRLLNPDPVMRMSVAEALEHPFLTQSRGKFLTRDMLPPQHETREFRDPERFIIQCLSLANDSDKPRLLKIFALQMPLLRRAMGADFDKPLAEIESRSRTVRRLLAEGGPAIPRRYFTFHLLLFCRRNRPSHGLIKQYENLGRSSNGLSSPNGGESPRFFPLSTGRSSKVSPRSLLQSPLTRRLNGRDTTRSTDEITSGHDGPSLSQPVVVPGLNIPIDSPLNASAGSKRKRPSSKKVALERSPPQDNVEHEKAAAPTRLGDERLAKDILTLSPAVKPSFLLARTVDAVTMSGSHSIGRIAQDGISIQQRQASESFKSRRRIFKESLDRPARNRPSKQPTPLLKPSTGKECDIVCCVQDSPKPHHHSRGCLSISLLPTLDHRAGDETDIDLEVEDGPQNLVSSTHTPKSHSPTRTLVFSSLLPPPPSSPPHSGISISTTGTYLSSVSHKRQRSSKRGDRGSRERDTPGHLRNYDQSTKASTAPVGPDPLHSVSDAALSELSRSPLTPFTRPVTPLRLRPSQHEHIKLTSHASDEVEEDDIRIPNSSPAERGHPSLHLGHQQSTSLTPSLALTGSVPTAAPSPTIYSHQASQTPNASSAPTPPNRALKPTMQPKSSRHPIDVSTVEAIGSPCSSLFPSGINTPCSSSMFPSTCGSSSSSSMVPNTKTVSSSVNQGSSLPQSNRLTIGVGSSSRIISSRLTNEWPLLNHNPSLASAPTQVLGASSSANTPQQTRTFVTLSKRSAALSSKGSELPSSQGLPTTHTAHSLGVTGHQTYMPSQQHTARDKVSWHLMSSSSSSSRMKGERQSLMSTPSLSTAPMIGYHPVCMASPIASDRVPPGGVGIAPQSVSPKQYIKYSASPATTKSKKPSSAESSTHRSMIVGTPPGARSQFARLQVTGAVKVIY